MKQTIFVFLAALLPQLALAETPPEKSLEKLNPIWIACERSEECIIIKDVCGWPKAASHKKFAQDVGKYNARLGEMISCPSWESVKDGHYDALCREKKCVPVARSTKPTLPKNNEVNAK